MRYNNTTSVYLFLGNLTFFTVDFKGIETVIDWKIFIVEAAEARTALTKWTWMPSVSYVACAQLQNTAKTSKMFS